MAKRRKKRGATVRIYYGMSDDPLYWTVPVSDAKETVRINGTLADAMSGKPGTTIGCHLSICAKRNASAFPHACKLASFTRTRCDIVDKIVRGKPVHAVRYAHSYGNLVDLNDKDASKKYLKEHPELVERVFTLRKPPKSRPRPNIGSDNPRARGTPTGEKRSYVPLGALRRAVEAGLVTAKLD